MKLKKAITLLLTAALVTPIFSGCGKEVNRHQTDANGEPYYEVSFNMYTQDDNEYPTADDTVFNQFMMEKFRLKFDYDRIPRTDWETKTNTYLAIGDSPDVTIGGKEINYKTWAKDLYLAPIPVNDDILKDWRKLWGSEEEAQRVIQLASSSDGNLYYLPTVRQEKVQMCWDYRKDAFEAIGVKEFPKTADEFYEVCKKLKEKFGGVIISSNGQTTSSLTGFFQMYWIPELILSKQSCVNPKTGEFEAYPMVSDRAREMYKFVNRLYKEGMIDHQILSMDKNAFSAQCAKNSAFITYNYVYNVEDFTKKTRAGDGNEVKNAEWVWAPNMVTAYEDLGTIFKKDPTYSDWGPAFSEELGKDKEAFEAVLKYYNWCATEEGYTFTTYGLTDEDAKKYGADGSYYLNENGEPEVKEGWYHEIDEPKGDKINKIYGTLANTFIKHPKRFMEARGNDIEKLWSAFSAQDNYYYFAEFPMRYTADEEDTYNDLVTALNTKRDEYMARFLMGESDPNSDADWNKYINDMKKVGLDRFIELQNKVYARTQEQVKAESENK